MEYSELINYATALVGLTSLEIILGIDNIILISILVEKLPKKDQDKARYLGLALALVGRIILLVFASWLSKMTTDIFSLFGKGFSLRDSFLIVGGLFLIAKATTEIFHLVENTHSEKSHDIKTTFSNVIFQIIIFDLIFSLDSVLTAVGMTNNLNIMVASVLIAIVVMIISAKKIGDFVAKNPSIKLLALSFLVLIGVLLFAEGFESHLNRGYVYFAMALSLVIEFLNKRRVIKGIKIEK